MNGPAPAPSRYRFADLTLDVGQRRLRRGDLVIPLSKLSFDLLCALVENAPNVVAHDELASRAWGPRRIVTPENIAKRVNLLRQALGDEAARSRYIEGIRGHGYRLIPGVVRMNGSDSASTAAVHERPAAEPTLAEPPRLPHNQRTAEADAVVAADGAVREPKTARRNVLVGALALAVTALAVDDYRLRRARREAALTTGRDEQRTFELYAPASSAFSAAAGWPQPALAPNGRELAFVAPSGSSPDVIWVQTLGSLEARPLRGTAQASFPAWAPDGRSIAFQSHGYLRRVAAAGGAAPTEIGPLGGPYWGAAWAVDDTLLFGGRDGLHRVAANGGKAVVWTTLDAGAGEYSHRFPLLLPDGRRFVYLALATNAEREGFYVGSLADRNLKIWLRSGHSQAALGHGPDGRLHLLFVGEHGELLAQPFDASHSKLIGDAVEVAPPHSVEVNGSARSVAVAASERALVYRPRVADNTRLVWRDRTGADEEILALPEGAYRHLALSHDGTMLAVERDALDDASGLWLIDRRRNQNRRLGPGQMSAWTRDDSSVVFSSVRPEGWRLDMKAVASTDAATQPLVTGFRPFVKRIRDVTSDGLLFQCEIAGESWLYYWPPKATGRRKSCQ